MKRFISVVLSVVLLCMSFNLTIFGISKKSPTITLDSADVAAGKQVTLNVNLKNNPGIISACINVYFDSGLTLIRAKNGNAFPSSITFVQPKQLLNGGSITDNCNFVWSGTDIKDKDIKDGVMLTLTFSVSDKAKSGDSYNIYLANRKGDIVDRDLSYVEVGTATGKVTVVNGASESDDDRKTNNLFRSFFDWLHKLIVKIKEALSKIVKA